MAFKLKADFLRCLGHPVRLAILELIKTSEVSVGQMVQALRVEQSSISKHLAILRQAGILKSRQEKLTVYYSITDMVIFQVLRPIAEVLRNKLEKSQKALAHMGET